MSFEPPRTPTRLPSLPGLAISAAAIAAIAGGAYLLLSPQGGPSGVRSAVGPPVQGAEQPVAAPEAASGPSRPARITIPAIGVDGPVVEMRLGPDGLWDADSIIGEVGHLQGTPWPGRAGNSALAAHVTVPGGAYGPFKDLHTLQAGNAISIWTHDGTLYTYQVVENKNVLATAVEVLRPTTEPTLTLITCSGWDDDLETYAERVVVIARLVGVEPPS